MSITTVGLDADDTLWHNETIFRLTHARFVDLLADHGDEATIEARLAETEQRNLRLYGYGIKGFTLSMIETAMELTNGEAPPHVVREILAAGREMLAHPVETLPGVDAVVAELSEKYRLVLITKGDLLDQERKLAASGLGDLFSAVEIVSEKDRATYERVFTRHGTGPAEAVMAGNSMKSDVLPAIAAGAFGVHIPYHVTWAHELADAPVDESRYTSLYSIADLKDTIDSWCTE
ncbi:HAD family hydrolase [Brevundimonas sp. GW460-12-10-14-LB2]|jgi:putative hydrolase of the HAD superfamily|uniref:HAD family hydrolase n=1 Tax=Brevundimonas sp. GW460-12-10-14-LB2 TaxID=1827469 RepID=UPI0007BCA066|nr:HAD family hydrolase [Brevundimonas sp. GW460-12-10-14-LB2]ANC52338.1 HAD family hydrolase [Brevundimonas sp. GW460-12-10-14-LB2]MEA3472702.1 HAD family hydrolase [Pseudomonadota bacterium]